MVFERVLHEDQQQQQKDNCGINSGHDHLSMDAPGTTTVLSDDQQQVIKQQIQYNNSSNISGSMGNNAAVNALGPCAADAYLMFQV